MRHVDSTEHAPLARMIAFLGLIALIVTACGTATPTPLPRTATPVPVVIIPTVTPALAAVPTRVITVTTTITSAAPVTATARVTRTVAVRTPTPKPATLSGRIAYGVVTAPAPQFNQIRVANVDGSNAHTILNGARWGALSPDGAHVAFFAVPGGGRNEGLYVADSGGGNPTKVYPASPGVTGAGVCCASWSPDGKWIVFADSPRPNSPGGPLSKVQVADKTVISLNVQGNGPAFSSDGKQIVFSGCEGSTCGVRIVSADGGAARFVTTDNGGTARWSPRGDKIVYQARDNANHMQVFVVNANGSDKKQLTGGKGNDGQPVWSRDGGYIFWRTDQSGTGWAISVMNADGANPRTILSDVPPHPDLWGWESLSVAP